MGKAGGICLDVSQTVKPARNLESNSNMILGLDASIVKKKKKVGLNQWFSNFVMQQNHLEGLLKSWLSRSSCCGSAG